MKEQIHSTEQRYFISQRPVRSTNLHKGHTGKTRNICNNLQRMVCCRMLL